MRCMSGPIGSGKSVAMCLQVYFEMCQMPPQQDGVRRSVWCFIRDTEPNLRDTTMVTWLHWFKEDVVSYVTRSKGNMKIDVKFDLPDGTKVESIIHCKHQKTISDIENLKSLELTGAFVNEANSIRSEAISMLFGRIGRYPSVDMLMGKKCRYSLLMDTNMPDDMHWYYKLAEIVKPKGWEFFRQPPAMLKEQDKSGNTIYVPNRGQKIAEGILPAENIQHLGEGWNYYYKHAQTATPEWMNVFVCGEYGTLIEGKPVYNLYSDARHHSDKELKFDPHKTLFLMFDFGRDPCCIICQMGWGGQVRVLEEVIANDRMGIERFWETQLKDILTNKYRFGRGVHLFAVGDPAGEGKNQVTEDSPHSYLNGKGIPVIPCLVQRPKDRIPCVDYFLSRSADKGEPALLLSKDVKILRKGFNGHYYYKRMEQFADEVYSGEPCKNSFSHPHDAFQYGCHVMKNLDLYDVDFRSPGGNGYTAHKYGDESNAPSFKGVSDAGI